MSTAPAEFDLLQHILMYPLEHIFGLIILIFMFRNWEFFLKIIVLAYVGFMIGLTGSIDPRKWFGD